MSDMSETQINVLPAEMLMRIFNLLPPQDMKMVVLVCNSWRKMGEDPSLWTSCRVTVANRGDLEKLNTRRMQQIQDIDSTYDL